MTKTGHRLTAGAFAVASAILMANGSVSISSVPVEYQLAYAALFAVGVMSGASAPDWLEGAFFFRNRRISIIPHRTLTHWLPVWLAAFYLVFTASLDWYVLALVNGFIASSVLHITMDAFSKSGVPLLLPMRRFSVKIPLYTTGGISEIIWSVAVLAFFLMTLVHVDKASHYIRSFFSF